MEKEKFTKAQIYRPRDCKDKMLHDLKHGKTKGSTTYNDTLDDAWKWKKQESNIWTGYANEGKSLFLKQLCLIKALKDKWRFAFSAPEDFPAHDFYDDIIHTLTGKSTDKDHPNCIDKETYEQAFNLIEDKFVFVYVPPPHNTIKGILEDFKNLCKEEQIDGCIIDPLLKFAWPKDFPDNYERYASYIGSLFVDFCRETNTSSHLIMHQVTPTFDTMGKNQDGSEKKRYSEPSMYRVKGGGSWADGFDNVLSIWRPNYAFDKVDPTVQFASQKIKKQKLVGIPQRINFSFDRKSNRYTEFNSNEPIFGFDNIMYPRIKSKLNVS